MSTLYRKYRDKVSEDEENLKVRNKCDKFCAVSTASSESNTCKSTLPALTAYFTGKKKYTGIVPAAYDSPDKFRCWTVLPYITSLSETPSTLKSEGALKSTVEGPCYDCLKSEREKMQAGMVYSPDARFWIGVGAASAGLLVAIMVKITQR